MEEAEREVRIMTPDVLYPMFSFRLSSAAVAQLIVFRLVTTVFSDFRQKKLGILFYP